MRLLKTSTITLEEFPNDHVPKYAILSHTWGNEEVSFQDLRDGKAHDLAGYAKIKGCCAQAIGDGLQYAWVDTCCIDKSSSAELSEAINSMYRWYQKARVCYVFLSDVCLYHDDPLSEFSQSRWFQRGWTLQELLAPRKVIFFDQEWDFMGTKASMSKEIKDVTGIQNLDRFDRACVAHKMSWASKRETTRVEDIAYCLMGLFGVNMPILYGEGRNAFIRLQLEILSKSDDESLFAWTKSTGETGTQTGFLASSPAAFSSCTDVYRSDYDPDRPPYLMTNKGLRLELLLFRSELDDFVTNGPTFIAPLKCRWNEKQIAICLRRMYRNSFVRISSDRLIFWDLASENRATNLGRMVLYIKEPDTPVL